MLIVLEDLPFIGMRDCMSRAVCPASYDFFLSLHAHFVSSLAYLHCIPYPVFCQIFALYAGRFTDRSYVLIRRDSQAHEWGITSKLWYVLSEQAASSV
jgi:hypothetical protein